MYSKTLGLLCLFTYVSLYFSRVEGLTSISSETLDIEFYLFTPQSKNANGERIAAADLNNNKITIKTFNRDLRLAVIVHGFLQSAFTPWIEKMREELMKKESRNVIVVNWNTGVQYFQAARNTREVGKKLAKLFEKLHSQFSFNLTNTHVIGHSLGAHVAGFAGYFLRMPNNTKLGRITGLDPAQLDFDQRSPDGRLDPSDADFVDVIHTDFTDSGYNVLEWGLGLERVSGHVDFYPNGGVTQPGCQSVSKNIMKFAGSDSLPLMIACDHMKAIEYFTSSINHQCSRKAFPCESWEVFKQGRCLTCQGACPEMGYNADQYHVNGSHKFYLSTYDNVGYCAPSRYVSVVLSGTRIRKHGFFWFTVIDKVNDLFKLVDNIIRISLTRQDGKAIRTSLSAVGDGNQISLLVPSEHRPGLLTSITLSYAGIQDMYVGKATVRDESNTYTACFNQWVSSGSFNTGLRVGHSC